MRYFVWAALALSCSGLAAQVPAARAEFEVASVRPVATDSGNGRLSQALREFTRGGRHPGDIPMVGGDHVQLKWALLDLIAAAYSVRASQVSGPEWMGDQVFDVEATVPPGTKKEALNGMMQTLLKERFGLKVHQGPQTEKGFALVVGKHGPKLEPAAPPPAIAEGMTEEEKRSEMQKEMQAKMGALAERRRESGAGADRSSSSSWDSISTEDLAAQLVRFAGAPVIDETGLTGKYSVTIVISKDPESEGGSVFDAVAKLGLKLEPRTLTVESVVVDAVSKVPTEN